MKIILEKEHTLRTIRRMSHEIIENNDDLNNVVIIGIKNKGVPLAKKIKENIFEFTNINIPLEELDISGYRDDIKNKLSNNNLSNLDNKTIVLVDDVLYTGRTVRAAMDALIDFGRPNIIRLAVLIDRGHRELPIRADYVGKNLPTSKLEKITVDFSDFNVYLS